jgi:multidrug resistance efflux pump
MIRKYVLPLVALGLLLFAVLHVFNGQPSSGKVAPPAPPPQSPFGTTVAGAGIVEAQTENISVGTQVPGIVTRVHVEVGQQVRAQGSRLLGFRGTPLFRLDDRHLQAELGVRQAALTSALKQLEKLVTTRKEEVTASDARIREAQANVTNLRDQLERSQELFNRGVARGEELVGRQQAYQVAAAQLARVQAEHAMLVGAAWEAERGVAEAAVAQARAQVRQTEIELDRLVVRALVDGEVLQVNVHPGEYVGTPAGEPLIVLGNVHQLHVRVDIDEHDIPRFRPGAPARASPRGHAQEEIDLAFVRVEPYVVPKRSLTGDNKERVDTRVLQVIYALDPGNRPLYVGQQLDVFIDGQAAQPVSTR